MGKVLYNLGKHGEVAFSRLGHLALLKEQGRVGFVLYPQARRVSNTRSADAGSTTSTTVATIPILVQQTAPHDQLNPSEVDDAI